MIVEDGDGDDAKGSDASWVPIESQAPFWVFSRESFIQFSHNNDSKA